MSDSPENPSPVRPRLDSIDIVRGAVMVLMALDHARDFFSPSFSPEDLSRTTPALFYTRWVTHFCAPVFVFLAGVSAYLHGTRPGRTPGQVSRFLFIRGSWLIVLEFTVVHCAWWMSPVDGVPLDRFFLQVIWAIGVSMVCLAGLLHLPRRWLAVVAIGMIGGHNLLDSWSFEQSIEEAGSRFSGLEALWCLLHVKWTAIGIGDRTLIVIYPLIPWIGVMALGHVIGSWFTLMKASRRSRLITSGLGALILFAVLRVLGGYGDPRPWTEQASPALTVASLLNCEKYPPSLCFLLMTLGPALLALAIFERARGVLTRFLMTFGRVPLFFYVTHVLLVNLGGGLYFWLRFEQARWGMAIFSRTPDDYVLDLAPAYLGWAGVVLALYPLCLLFARLKSRSRAWWLSYL